MKIKVYTTKTCHYCTMAKEYLTSKGVAFDEVDVSMDRGSAEEMVKISGQRGVPVIIFDNEVVVGFDKLKIDKFVG